MQEMQVRSLHLEDLLEEEMATHSSILAWEISWTEESGGLQSMGSQKSRERLRCGLGTSRSTSRSIHTSIPLRSPGFYTQTCFLSVSGGGLNVSTVTVT